ncbi:trimeric intracellular cation channel family protein [Flavobacterium ardleyense]|uniref:trimeric intracellular cation channel family protein n=1 Tax=Flavobacterium ardleyense TaxID=2038737 RepID=UPI00298D2E9D|nr:trimeric intracellular cation channel family protein [Flavobacterium ardleyense]
MFFILEIIGTVAFAISGALTAMQKKMDPFGVFIIAFATAAGGGTLRDVMIGSTPVGWMLDLSYIYMIIVGFILAIIFKIQLDKLRISMMLFDTIGLSVFALIGLQKGIDYGLHPAISIGLGTITACFGGVLRDILCAEIPIIFRREIYATLCILGGVVFFVLKKNHVPMDLVYLISAITIAVLRVLVVKFKWSLPTLGRY